MPQIMELVDKNFNVGIKTILLMFRKITCTQDRHRKHKYETFELLKMKKNTVNGIKNMLKLKEKCQQYKLSKYIVIEIIQNKTRREKIEPKRKRNGTSELLKNLSSIAVLINCINTYSGISERKNMYKWESRKNISKKYN